MSAARRSSPASPPPSSQVAPPLPAPPAKPPGRRQSAENRRGQILEVALSLFIERGFEGVSMGDIAQALGTSRPTVYTYFASTEAILDALFAERLEQLPARLSPFLQAPEPPAERQSLPAFGAVFRALLQERELLMLLQSGGGPRFRVRRNAFLEAIEEKLNLRELGRASSAARGQPPQPLLLPIILNVLTGMAYEQLTQKRLDADALTDVLERFIAGGISGVMEFQSAGQPQEIQPQT